MPKEELTMEALLSDVSKIVAAYVSRNQVASSDLPAIIRAVHNSLANLGAKPANTAEPIQPPAVPIRKSVQPDFLVCLEDGTKLKMLKRHLRTAFNMTPDEYRAKWNLPSDYPMVAPNYAATRSAFAKQFGLGRKK